MIYLNDLNISFKSFYTIQIIQMTKTWLVQYPSIIWIIQFFFLKHGNSSWNITKKGASNPPPPLPNCCYIIGAKFPNVFCRECGCRTDIPNQGPGTSICGTLLYPFHRCYLNGYTWLSTYSSKTTETWPEQRRLIKYRLTMRYRNIVEVGTYIVHFWV